MTGPCGRVPDPRPVSRAWLPLLGHEDAVRSWGDQSLGAVAEPHQVRRLAPWAAHFKDRRDAVTLIEEPAVKVQLIADVGLHGTDQLPWDGSGSGSDGHLKSH